MRLPLYPDPLATPVQGGLLAPIQGEIPRMPDSACNRCALSQGCKSVCVRYEGDRGGLLVVGGWPDRSDDAAGKPMQGGSGAWARGVLRKSWTGPVAYDLAVKCAPGAHVITETHIDACRPYLAQTLRDLKPTRILCLGTEAAYAVLGRKVPSMSTRRAFAWLEAQPGPAGYKSLSLPATPVFVVQSPRWAQSNAFIKRWFEADTRWALQSNPPFATPSGGAYQMVANEADARVAQKVLSTAPWASLDCEWWGSQFNKDFELLDVGLGPCDQDLSFQWDRKALRDPGARKVLIEILTDPALAKGGHNIKGDLLAVQLGLGCQVANVRVDTQLWASLLDVESDTGLNDANERVGMGAHKAEAFATMAQGLKALGKLRDDKRAGRAQQRSFFAKREDPFDWLSQAEADKLVAVEDTEGYQFALIPDPIRARYNARDVIATSRLGLLLEDQLAAAPSVLRAWDRLIHPAIEAYAQVETWGVKVNPGALQDASQFAQGEADQILARLRAYDPKFRPGAASDVIALLYGKLKLKPPDKTESGSPSTDADSLKKLVDQHPAVKDILAWRKLDKVLSTYSGVWQDGRMYGGLLQYIRDDGLIHTSYNLDGARSGRISSRDPAIQNIPTRTSLGKLIKNAFVARHGCKLVQADYGQLEYRVAAILSADPDMLAALKTGEDFHMATARLLSYVMWGVAPDQITPAMRQDCKGVNFGLLFGQTDRTLATNLYGDASPANVKKATTIRTAILGKYKGLAKQIKTWQAFTHRTGTCETCWDGQPARVRNLFRIGSANDGERINCENAAVNSPIQGTASDYCMRSVIDMIDWIKREKFPARVVLTVHDSIVLECETPFVKEAAGALKAIMLSHNSLGVPLAVDVDEGEAWGSMHRLVV